GKLIEIEALRRDGVEILVQLAITALEVDGAPIFTAYLRDITERRRAEDANRRLAAIIESFGDAIIGKPISTLVPSERHDEELRIIERLRRGERIVRYDTIGCRKDGTLLDISL